MNINHLKQIVIAVIALGIFTCTAFAQDDKAVDNILKKNQTEVEKAKALYDASVKRSNDQAIKTLTNLIRARSRDAEGIARCKNAIAKINGEDVEEDAGGVVAGVTYPEGTFKWRGCRYYVFPKTKWASYEEAETACKELGGHVLRISSKKEYEYFENYRTKELKRSFWIVLEKFDIRVKDDAFKQTEYSAATEFGSSDVNYPLITKYAGKTIYFSNIGIRDHLVNEVFVICEWDK